jgi:hypothetical protein
MKHGCLKEITTLSSFHREANGRKCKQIIYVFEDGANHITGDEDLLKHATSYYKTLFGHGAAFTLDSSLWPLEENVSEEENEELVIPFLVEEIHYALFQMEKNKATGPDGFPIEFYQTCCQFIRQDILDLFMDFYANSLDIKRLNYGIITWIPKIKDAAGIQQFRPICLLNCIYKWFTKVMTLRLELVAKRIIHMAQADTFIGGRNIMNNVLALHEILHEIKRNGKLELC